MWQDYIGILPAIAVAAMGIVTLAAREMPRWKRNLAIVLTIVAIGAISFNQWRTSGQIARQTEAAARHEAHISELKKFYVEVDTLFRKEMSVTTNTTPDEYKQLSDEIEDFSRRLESWVGANMGPAAKSHLLRIPSAPSLSFSNAISKDHNAALNVLPAIKQSIDDLITNSAWDSPSPKYN